MLGFDVLDIGADDENRLSTFKEYGFTLDGVACRTMESFLRSLTVQNVELQESICKLTARDAIAKSEEDNSNDWRLTQKLYWRGQELSRNSREFSLLICRAFEAMSHGSKFQKALKSTGDSILVNRFARSDKSKVLLTEDEQCNELTLIRAGWQEEEPSYSSF